MGAERTEASEAAALEVLRDVWRGQAQTVADLDDSCESHCKKMTDAGVGFDDYAAGDETDRGRGVAGQAGARGQAQLRRQPARPRHAAGRRTTPLSRRRR